MLTVILPLYNNAETLDAVCTRLRVACAPVAPALVCVDDGSTDQSADIARHCGAVVISHPTNRGHNAAVLTGLATVRCGTVCVLDADLGDTPEDVPTLVAALGTARVAFSSRAGAQRLSSRMVRWLLHAAFPSLPPVAGLAFATDAETAARIVAAAGPEDYVPAVIGALGVKTRQVFLSRGPQRATSGYTRRRRWRHGWGALRTVVTLKWRLAIAHGRRGTRPTP